MSDTRPSNLLLKHQDAEEELTESTQTDTTITERSPLTAVDTGCRDETTISESMRSDQDEDPDSGSTQTGPDPLDPHDFMTSSYSEISFASDPDDNIEPEEAFGPSDQVAEVQQLSSTIVNWTTEAIAAASDGQTSEQRIVSYVADDFDQKLRLSSTSPSCETLSHPQSGSSSSATPDFTALQQIETAALNLRSSIDQVIENINTSTHRITGLTVGCINSYETCLNSAAEVVDSNIKSMYQLMAQVEELNRSMHSIVDVKKEVAQVKQMLDLFEKLVP